MSVPLSVTQRGPAGSCASPAVMARSLTSRGALQPRPRGRPLPLIVHRRQRPQGMFGGDVPGFDQAARLPGRGLDSPPGVHHGVAGPGADGRNPSHDRRPGAGTTATTISGVLAAGPPADAMAERRIRDLGLLEGWHAR